MLTLTLLGLIAAIVVPPAVVVALLMLVTSVQRTREEAAARQVAVTDAIHRELGAVVAPVVRRRGWRAWELRVAVPMERPNIVATVLAVAHRTLARFDPRSASRVHFVLVPREQTYRR